MWANSKQQAILHWLQSRHILKQVDARRPAISAPTVPHQTPVLSSLARRLVPGMDTIMKPRTAVSALALLSVLLLAAWFGMRWGTDAGLGAGLKDGAETLERLQLVWPDFEHMPDDDRRNLAYLAMRCRLHQEPMAAQNVVGCLKRATTGAESAVRPAALSRLLPPQYAASVELQ